LLELFRNRILTLHTGDSGIFVPKMINKGGNQRRETKIEIILRQVY
jgi:hypothetical protein